MHLNLTNLVLANETQLDPITQMACCLSVSLKYHKTVSVSWYLVFNSAWTFSGGSITENADKDGLLLVAW